MLRDSVPEKFWEALSSAGRCVLFVDYDGTLAPFQVDREAAFPYPGVQEALRRIAGETDTRLVIVSGRWTRDLRRLLPLDPPPEIFGSHGLERLFADGRYEVRELDEKAVAGLSEIDAMALQGGLEEHLERKPGCLALHWRGLDTRTVERMHRVVLYDWQKVAGKSGLSIFGFNGGMEVRAPLCDKGDAVRTVLEEEPEGTAIAYLGDDMTDEDAFEAVENRGLGILVAAEPRESVATIWLAPPEGVTGFLLRWADVRGGKRMKPESQRVRP